MNNLTAHIFRHNYCTQMCYAGISIKKLTELMGHANSKMIMDIYSHVDAEKEQITDKLNKIYINQAL